MESFSLNDNIFLPNPDHGQFQNSGSSGSVNVLVLVFQFLCMYLIQLLFPNFKDALSDGVIEKASTLSQNFVNV